MNLPTAMLYALKSNAILFPSPYRTVKVNVRSGIEGLELSSQNNSSSLSVKGKASKPGQITLEINEHKLLISLKKNEGAQAIATILRAENYSVTENLNRKTGITELHLQRSLVSPAR